MKTTFFVLLATIAIPAFAQTIPGPVAPSMEHPCQEFIVKQGDAEQKVKYFDREMRKTEAKLRNIEDRLAVRSQALRVLQDQYRDISEKMKASSLEQSRLKQDITRMQTESSNLNQVINQKEALRQYHVKQASATSDLNVKREHLRQSKLLERELLSLTPQLTTMNSAISANMQQIARIDSQVKQQAQQLESLNVQISNEQRDPAIQRLEQDRNEVMTELANSQNQYDILTNGLAKATSHVTMCQGYLELSVKYPTALKLAKKISKLTCQRYQPADQGSELENEAQDEILASICR